MQKLIYKGKIKYERVLIKISLNALILIQTNLKLQEKNKTLKGNFLRNGSRILNHKEHLL